VLGSARPDARLFAAGLRWAIDNRIPNLSPCTTSRDHFELFTTSPTKSPGAVLVTANNMPALSAPRSTPPWCRSCHGTPGDDPDFTAILAAVEFGAPGINVRAAGSGGYMPPPQQLRRYHRGCRLLRRAPPLEAFEVKTLLRALARRAVATRTG
jgi:hypothetical protein